MMDKYTTTIEYDTTQYNTIDEILQYFANSFILLCLVSTCT